LNVETRLSELGMSLPVAPNPVAAYVPAIQAGSLLYISGQLPFRDGQLLAQGPVPSAVAPDLARQAAAQCVLNGLAIVKQSIGGDWSRLVRIVRVGVFVQSDSGFSQQPAVANGASELLQEILGEAGRHARAAVGVNALPLNACVEVELLVEVSP